MAIKAEQCVGVNDMRGAPDTVALPARAAVFSFPQQRFPLPFPTAFIGDIIFLLGQFFYPVLLRLRGPVRVERHAEGTWLCQRS